MFIIPLPFPYLRTSTVHHNLMFVPNLRPSRCKWSYTEFIDTNKKLQFFGISWGVHNTLWVLHIIKSQRPSSMSLDHTKLFHQHIQMKTEVSNICCTVSTKIAAWLVAGLLQCCSWPAVTSDHSPAPAISQTRAGARNRRAGGEGSLQPGPLGARLRSHGSGNSQERGTGGSWHPPLSRLEELKIARLWSSWVFCEMENTCHCHRVMQQTRTEDVEIF